jgi:hypothetical protein
MIGHNKSKPIQIQELNVKSSETNDIITSGEVQIMRDLNDQRIIDESKKLSEEDLYFFSKKFELDSEFKQEKGWVFHKSDLEQIEIKIELEITKLDRIINNTKNELINKIIDNVKDTSCELIDRVNELREYFDNENMEYTEQREELNRDLSVIKQMQSLIDYYSTDEDCGFAIEEPYDEVKYIIMRFV